MVELNLFVCIVDESSSSRAWAVLSWPCPWRRSVPPTSTLSRLRRVAGRGQARTHNDQPYVTGQPIVGPVTAEPIVDSCGRGERAILQMDGVEHGPS
jgi:hypothetical protein